MTSRERVIKTLTFNYPDKVPKDLWISPIAYEKYKEDAELILEKFPVDIERPKHSLSFENFTRGNGYMTGIYMDEWGCVFQNLRKGLFGQVKEPLIKNLSDVKKIKPPYELLKEQMETVKESCKRKGDKFLLGGVWRYPKKYVLSQPTMRIRPFERMQFLRGTTNLFMDIIEQLPEFFKFRDIVHQYYIGEVKSWGSTDVDGIEFMDDWGGQNSLLISPTLWRKLFKPLYKDYCEIIHEVNKFAFMHSDGYIFDILEDLIEIGVDVINCQLFCMNVEEIGRKFKGKITFWGEIDRQHILPSQNLEDVRRSVKKVKKFLYSREGGVIAQCEFGAGARPKNIRVVFEEWEK